jgi:hypothetical protein
VIRRLLVVSGAALVVAALTACAGKPGAGPSGGGTPLPGSVDVVISTESLQLLESRLDGTVEVIDSCLAFSVSSEESAVSAYVLVLPPGSERTDTGMDLPGGRSIHLGDSITLAGGEAPEGGIDGYLLPASCSAMPAFLVNDQAND